MKKIMMGVALLVAAASAVLAGTGDGEAPLCGTGDGPAKCCKCTADNLPGAAPVAPACCPCPRQATR